MDNFNVAGIESPLLDARILISHVLDMEPYLVAVERDLNVTPQQLRKIKKLVSRRLTHEPVAYITGFKEFYSLPFAVTRDVLIPRPETELAVDLAIYYADRNSRVLDLGTGSGAIAVSIKHCRPDIEIFASDISQEALKVAKKNAKAILGPGAVRFFHGPGFEPFDSNHFDVIVSNPPYINPEIAGTLQKELAFEPPIALFSMDRGREMMRGIIGEGRKYLSPRGMMIIEIGYDMKDFLTVTAGKAGFDISVMNDHAGLPRMAVLKQ